MLIAGHEIGKEPFLIAEVGLNHCGSIERAIQMIEVAAACGVTAVKFQTFRAQDVCDESQVYSYISQGEEVTEPRINIFRRCELPEDAWPLLKHECDKHGVVFLSTPETPADLDILLRVGIPAIKIASDNLTNMPMLRACTAAELPIILSTGMGTEEEIEQALYELGAFSGVSVVLLVCTSEYPCPSDAVNIRRVARGAGDFLRYSNFAVGFSDHTTGNTAAVMAVALGASVFETHFTLDRNLPGPDHWWAKTPQLLGEWVGAINEAWMMRGDGIVRPSAKELEAKAKYQRRIA